MPEHYLTDRPTGQPVWPGNWADNAADMLRIDLDTAGVTYVVEGPAGPLYADFHSLRHSFISLLDKSGASLKVAMQLARHSDPKLTMARYGRAQLHDLGQAVDRLPSLSSSLETEALRATGTEGAYTPLTQSSDGQLGKPMVGDGNEQEEVENIAGRKSLKTQGLEASCDLKMADDGSSPSRTRTYNKPVNSRLLYH